MVAHTLLPILHRLVAFCWDLPASAAHHHSRPFGLLTHSLEVAQHALRAFSQSSLWWATVPDPAQRHRSEGCWRLGTALAGLLHDGGKVFDVTVTLPAVPAWNPLQEPLLAWLLAHQAHGTLPTPTVTWQPGRGMRHQTLGALAAALLLTPEDLVHLTLPVARELWAFLGGDPDPANLFHQLLVRRAGPGSPTARSGSRWAVGARRSGGAAPAPAAPGGAGAGHAGAVLPGGRAAGEPVPRPGLCPGRRHPGGGADGPRRGASAARHARACACQATPCSSTTSLPLAICWGRRGRMS